MRDGLLSIGELARMKGVGVKSLRYYESIGIFRPAFVDPSSGYRYYSLNQLMDLDAITTCIELGIPLKELRDYIEPSGMLDLTALLERGRRRALARIAEAQAVLAQVSAQLDEINEQRAFSESGGAYVRRKEKRAALVQDWAGESFDVRRYARWMTEAYGTAKRMSMVPSYLQGFLLEPVEERDRATSARPGRERRAGRVCAAGCEGSSSALRGVRARAYLEVLPVGLPEGSSNAADPEAGEGAREVASAGGIRLQELPAGRFWGRRLPGSSLEACFDEAADLVRRQNVRAIATEVWDAHLDPSTYVVEVLVACD